jgi:hypothetical protein
MRESLGGAATAYHAGFYDMRDVPVAMLEHGEISERITIDDNKIGKCALSDTTELALHLQQFGID